MSDIRKTWFITGASSGFGRAFALYALSKGHNVVATARNISRLESLVAEAPDRVLALALDVDRTEDAQAAIDAAVARFGRIDALVNNAGYGIVGAVEETSENELRAVMETNFFGAIAVTRAALPVLRAQRAGALVNISSMGGQMSAAGFGPYSASKFALEGMSEALAQELAPFGVKVLIVEPGAFRTEFAGSALRHMPIIEAYRAIVGGMRDFASAMNATQEGDPLKAAAAIDEALNAADTPLRLALGRDSVAAVRAHAENLLEQMKAWEAVSLNTSIDAAAK
jgi:NAD(P)-dependent dehydrogenase (short-subunit alcohol dehydrogenase family)